MTELLKDGQRTGLFFDGGATIEQVATYIESNWLCLSENKLQLNEPHSCSLFLNCDETIIVSGDEDYINELTLSEIIPIKV